MKDPKLSLCSPATRGIWIDLICGLHELGQSGQVTGTPEQISRLCRCTSAEMRAALSDLQTTQAAEISERNGVFTVVNRRLRDKQARSLIASENGSKGGSKTASKIQAVPDYDNEDEGLERVREFARGIGVRQTDADWFFWKCHGNGWTNGGKSIRDWKATLRSWYSAGYLPSQKNGVVPLKTFVLKPKDGRDIPDRMKSWLIEKDPSTRDRWDEWEKMGDVPEALRGMWFAHLKKQQGSGVHAGKASS